MKHLTYFSIFVLLQTPLFVLHAADPAPRHSLTNGAEWKDGKPVALPNALRPNVETVLIYQPSNAWTYSHHQSITFFKGKFYAIWSNGREHEDREGQRVLMSTASDFKTWSTPRPLVDSIKDDKGVERVLTAAGFHQHEGTLVAYFGNYGPKKETTHLQAVTTTDGESWSAIREMGVPVNPNHGPQRTASGRLIIAGNISFPYTDDPAGLSGWRMTGIYPETMAPTIKDDPASFWEVSRKQGWNAALCEGSFYQTDDGVLHMPLRSTGKQFRNRLWLTESRDNGATWSTPVETAFSDTDAKFHFGRLPDGRFYYVGNPIGRGRSPLVLSLSRDGLTFDRHFILGETHYEKRKPGAAKGGEYGYPHTLIHDGYLYVIVSRQKEAVEVLRVALSAIHEPTASPRPSLIPVPTNVQWREGVMSKEGVVKEIRVAGLPAEGYELEVTTTGATIRSSSDAGAFYAKQTLQQLRSADGSWPCVAISDAPRFAWRGFMLDSSRHFQTVEEIKRWLDLLAMHKLNVFHWHLTDGHGWRIEIKKYPKLVSVGAFREQPPVGRYGGYYTQAEIRDIVAYATARHITVVPEIEMPGHSKAAVAAYPERVACAPKQPAEVDRFYDFPCPAQRFPSVPGSDVLCAGKESTYQFLSEVLDEVMALFPSPYIHVGGDEVNTQSWSACSDCQRMLKEQKLANWSKLQAYLMQRVEKQLKANGRKLIGWDEIIEGGLSETASVTSWRGIEGGIHAAKTGHDAVMSPGKPLYLDHGQSDAATQPAHWPGKETLQEIYGYEPVPAALDAEQARHILGLQGNLWSCFTHTQELLEIQAFPRLCAVAEIGWSPRPHPPYADFESRLAAHEQRLEALGVNFWREPKSFPLGTWSPNPALKGGTAFDLALASPPAPGKWVVGFRYQKGADALMVDAVELLADGRVVSSDVHEGTAGAQHLKNLYSLTVPATDSAAKWSVRVKAHVEPWSRGGQGDTAGVVTLSADVPVRTYAPELPLPAIRATTPVTQNRDKAIYDWSTRHQQVLDQIKKSPPEIVMIGDSITHYWGGEPKAPIVRSADAWSKAFGGRPAVNLGFGWDRTENALWRVEHGELDGVAPRQVVLLIGTNNLGMDTPEEVLAGVDALCRAIHEKLPESRLLVLGLLPRKDQAALKADLDKVNYLFQTRLHPRPYIDVVDFGNSFRHPDGSINLGLFSDGLHPNAAGYELLGKLLSAALK